MRSSKSSNGKARVLDKKAASFHGKIPMRPSSSADLQRPKTMPDLWPEKSVALQFSRPKLTKLLLNVAIQGSVGSLQVVMLPENTVGDLIAAAVKQYSKECRRPIMPTMNPECFDLHYSQFSLESLPRGENLMELGSRNFFLCTRKAAKDVGDATATASCSKEAEKVSKSGSIPWLKFMDFLP